MRRLGTDRRVTVSREETVELRNSGRKTEAPEEPMTDIEAVEELRKKSEATEELRTDGEAAEEPKTALETAGDGPLGEDFT